MGAPDALPAFRAGRQPIGDYKGPAFPHKAYVGVRGGGGVGAVG